MRAPWIIRRLSCALQDHIRVTADDSRRVGNAIHVRAVTRCTRCGYEWERTR